VEGLEREGMQRAKERKGMEGERERRGERRGEGKGRVVEPVPEYFASTTPLMLASPRWLRATL